MLSLKAQRIILLAYLPIVAPSLPAQPNRWSPPINISHTTGSSTFPALAVGSNGIIHAVWEDDSRLGNPWMNDILYTSGDGVQWAEPVQLSGMDTTFSFLPRIAVDAEGRPHVVWNHHAIFPDGAIYYATLTDSGWTEPLNLTPWNSTRYAPDIAIDGNGLIHVIWTDYIFGNGEIVHSYFNGQEWSPIENVSNDSLDSGWSRILVDSANHLHVVWANIAGVGIQCQVYYTFFDGVSWCQTVNLSLTDSLPSIRPDLAVDPYDHPHVVWNQVTQWGSSGVVEEIFYRHHDGAAWSEAINLTNLGLRTADYPVMAISDGNEKFVLFGLSSDTGDMRVNYMYSTDSTWSYPDSIFEGHFFEGMPDITIDCEGVAHACLIVNYQGDGFIGYTCNEYFTSAEMQMPPLMANFDSLWAYPSPFNSHVKLCYRIAKICEPVLGIFNIRGQLIREILQGTFDPGEHVAFWNGKDQFGKEVSAGIYFARLLLDGKPITQKLILLK